MNAIVCMIIRSRGTLRPRALAAVAIALVATAGCGSSAGYRVADGTYVSIVPSAEQFDADVDGDLPGGVAPLRQQGVDRIEVDIAGDEVTFRLDGTDAATIGVAERIDITDSEGSGPLKGKKQILVLADPLVLGDLVIDEPVIWPGSFEDSPVITVKPRNPGEQGPAISCRADEPCLLLSSGVDPDGRYEDANNPELDQNPIESIVIDAGSVDITLDSGEHVMVEAGPSSTTQACGLSENPVWDLPSELGLPIDDPVLIHTLCPSTPGAAIELVIMGRADIPVLAPLTEAREGDWCTPATDCLVFVPTDQ